MSSIQAMRALASQAKNQQQENTEKESNPVEEGMKNATAELLKQSWINLIPSWGLTVIYLNIHVFGSKIAKKFFSQPGEEWIKMPGGGNAITRSLGLFELIALLVLDMLIGLAILVLAVFIYILVDAWLHPVQTFWTVFILHKLPGT